MTEQEAVELTKRYQSRLNRLAIATGTLLAGVWDRLGAWDERDVERFATSATPILAGAHRAGGALASGYLGLLLDTSHAPDVGHLVEAVDLRSPFLGYWAAFNRGDVWAEAITTGRTRADTLGHDGVHTAARAASSDASRGEKRIVGWQRVLVGTSCEFCATVSTQRYHSAEAASFGHRRCDCTIVPIVGSSAPGRVINAGLRDRLKRAGDTSTGYVNADGTPAPRPGPAPVEVP